jgi:hypothetical protein
VKYKVTNIWHVSYRTKIFLYFSPTISLLLLYMISRGHLLHKEYHTLHYTFSLGIGYRACCVHGLELVVVITKGHGESDVNVNVKNKSSTSRLGISFNIKEVGL